MVLTCLQETGAESPVKHGDSDQSAVRRRHRRRRRQFNAGLQLARPDGHRRPLGSSVWDGERMIEAMAADPKLARRCAADSPVTHGEIRYAVREEMVLTLEDYLERRGRLFLWDVQNGLSVAQEAAQIMGEMLGWDRKRIDAEVAAYRHHVEDVKGFCPPVETAPQRAANA
jgi:glycerol-3-phosphate dehydrogenase